MNVGAVILKYVAGKLLEIAIKSLELRIPNRKHISTEAQLKKKNDVQLEFKLKKLLNQFNEPADFIY